MSRTDLTRRMEEAMRVVAEAVEFPPPDFDPGHHAGDVVDSGGDVSCRRSGARTRWLVAAAVIVAAMLAGAVAAQRAGEGGGGRAEVVLVADSGEEQYPDGLRAPAWVPDGMRLVSVGWETSDDHGPNPFSGRHQLFEDPDGSGRVVVHVLAMTIVAPTFDSTVRGVPAHVTVIGDEPASKIATWQEGGAVVMAYADGMTAGDLTAFLDGLERRAIDIHEGFAAPATSPLVLTSEGVEDSDLPPSLTTTFVYSPDAGTVAERLVVDTTAQVEAPAPYEVATAEITASDQDDNNDVGDAGPVGGTRRKAPDGTEVWVQVFGTTVDGDDVDRLIDSVGPIAAADVARLRDEMDTTALDMPLEAAADLPSGTVEVRGAGDVHLACLRSAGGDLRCAGLANEDAVFTLDGLPEEAEGGFVIGGRWFAVAAVRGEPGVEWSSRPSHPSLDDQAETTVVGNWELSLLQVPDSLDRVWGGSGLTPLHRPPSA